MEKSAVFEALRNAISDAQVVGDAELDFQETSRMGGLSSIQQLIISYKTGNEYLRLDRLLDNLKEVGKVEVFEYRGRGAGEAPSIVADIKVDGSRFQVIYRTS